MLSKFVKQVVFEFKTNATYARLQARPCVSDADKDEVDPYLLTIFMTMTMTMTMTVTTHDMCAYNYLITMTN